MEVALQKAHDDNRLLLTAMQRIDAGRRAEISALRNDLETVAINAETSIKQTDQQLIQLAAYLEGSDK